LEQIASPSFVPSAPKKETSMKVLNPTVHGILDYATVIAFAIAPTVFGFAGMAAIISYVLAGVHLVMTILTHMPLSAVKLIPMRVHAMVEMVVGPLLIAGALLLPSIFAGAQTFFVASGIAICVVWLLSDYASASQ
jgi:hypothetical protein